VKILWLVSRDYFETKMSRVRFHSMAALAQKDDVYYYGPGWGDWDDNKTCQENIDSRKFYDGKPFDLVIGFKPLDMKGFKDIKIRKCLRYNEMFDVNWTITEIVQSNTDIVICHHYNDYLEYTKWFSEIKGPKQITFKYVPHSAEKTIFKPMPEVEKKFDVLIVGATHAQTMLGDHYPLRKRMCDLIYKLPPKYKVGIVPHAGGNHSDAHTDKYAKQFAEIINSAKIVITDSGAPKSRFGKYQEIPACGVAIAGDVYDDHPDDVKRLKEFLIGRL